MVWLLFNWLFGGLSRSPPEISLLTLGDHDSLTMHQAFEGILLTGRKARLSTKLLWERQVGPLP